MIEELEGTVAETLANLATSTLDPRDEKVFWDSTWTERTGGVWELQGRFLDTDYAFRLRNAGDYAGVQPLIAAIVANTGTPAYRSAWRTFIPLLDEWLRIGRENEWISRAWDPPFNESSFALCRTPEQMARVVAGSDWSLGTAFVLAGTDVCMIQICEGAGEFLVIRGETAFEFWTTGPGHLHGPKLAAYLAAVVDAPLDTAGRPLWYDRVRGGSHDVAAAVVAAGTDTGAAPLLLS